MQRLKTRIAAATIAASLACVALPAAAQTYYTINGQPAPYDFQVYLAQRGAQPGHYWLDANGYWGAMGYSQPLGNINEGSYVSPQGSGEQGPNGWSHWDNTTGTYVGGDNNGCYYASDWSNC